MPAKVLVHIGCAAVLFVVACADNVWAQANFFVPEGGVGNWSVVESWTAGHLPTTGETALVHAGREATVDSFISDAPEFLRLADFDTEQAVDGTLNVLDGADLFIHDQLLVAAGENNPTHGVLNQSGGNLQVGGALFLAFESSHSAEYNLSGGSLTVGNLWFRFGNGLLTQTGGSVSAANIVLAEGGAPGTESLYDLKAGTLDVLGTAFIGSAFGADTFENSNGSMKISGTGVATMEDVFFGDDATDTIRISGSGVLNVNQFAYSEADALADIAAGKILGDGLRVATVQINFLNYTQITSTAAPLLYGDFNNDGIVDAADFTAWRDNLGAVDESPINDRGDGLNGVDAADYGVWKAHFGEIAEGSGALAAVVPEPACLLMLVGGLATACTSRRLGRIWKFVMPSRSNAAKLRFH